MSFHDNLVQSFQNFKDTFLGSTDISGLGDGTITDAINELDSSKQDALTFDTTPTQNSGNPITSGGVYTAIAGINSITIDSSLDSTSENPVQNKAIKSVLDGKQDTLTAGTRITINSNTISASSEIDDSSTGSTATWSAEKIISYLSNFSSLNMEIVTVLPSSNISSSTIYLVRKTTGGTNNNYDEYVYLTVNEFEDITDDVVIVINNGSLPVTGVTGKYYITADDDKVYTWENTAYEESQTVTSTVVASLPVSGLANIIYRVTSDNTSHVWERHTKWEIIGSTSVDLTGYYTSSEVTSLLTSMSTAQSTTDSTQTSQISSLSTSTSEIASTLTSMSTAQSSTDSSQDSQISSLASAIGSAAGSDYSSEISSLTSENSTQSSEIASISASQSELASTASSLSLENSTQSSEISSLASVNSTQTSEINSLASEIGSLSTENSTQTSEIGSLSTAQSELGSEVTELSSEVATKQDSLTAGSGINIDIDNVISTTGATIYASALYPSGS